MVKLPGVSSLVGLRSFAACSPPPLLPEPGQCLFGLGRGSTPLIKHFPRKSALANHRANRSNRNVLPWMRHNHGVPFGVAIFGMTAVLRDELKSMPGQDAKKSI